MLSGLLLCCFCSDDLMSVVLVASCCVFFVLFLVNMYHVIRMQDDFADKIEAVYDALLACRKRLAPCCRRAKNRLDCCRQLC